MKFLTFFGMLILVSGVTFGQDDIVTDDKLPENEDGVVTGNPSSAPSTTATPPVTTTAITPVDPKTEKKPAKGKYYLSQNNKTCIMLEMSGRLTFTYTKNTTTNKTEQGTVMWDIPPQGENGTKVGGQCKPENETDVQRLELTFFEDWKMTISFNKTKNKQYFISVIALQYSMDSTRFPNTSESSTDPMTSSKSMKEYQVDKDKSFRCVSEESITKFKGGNLTSLQTWDLHVQAFRSDNKTEFGSAVYCDGDTKVSNLVPIIVGAALAGLVLIVLVAYLIGRHRNRSGYQSV